MNTEKMNETIQTKKRLPSKSIWINDIVTREVVKGSGWDPSYIVVDGQNISRVNLVATVVSKFVSEDGNYGSITLDDGSETIRVKAFGPDVIKIENTSVGKLIRFGGKIKEYNEEIYLAPEIIRNLEDPNWIVVHKLLLGKPKSEVKQEEIKIEISQAKAEEEIKRADQNISKTVLDIIRSLSGSEGAVFEEVISKSGLDDEEGKNVIIGLLKSGDIYEPKKGKLKVLD
ncbi:MAG: hypothetical protein AABW84_00570 [Nanoarchaeota archaeon]